MKKVAVIIGSKSDIAIGLIPLLRESGYSIRRWHRGTHGPIRAHYDLLITFTGTVGPVGKVRGKRDDMESTFDRMSTYHASLHSNLVIPLWHVGNHECIPNKGATVIFMAGSNPNSTMPGYVWYTAGKMGLVKAAEWLDAEEPDIKVLSVGPGTVLTKIHNTTIKAKWHNPKLGAAIMGKKSTPIEKIHDCIMWCVKQPKEVVGGRNICVSDSPDWRTERTLPAKLKANPNAFKLRRIELETR